MSLTEMGVGDKEKWEQSVWDWRQERNEFNFRHVKFEMRMRLSISMLGRQIYEWSFK